MSKQYYILQEKDKNNKFKIQVFWDIVILFRGQAVQEDSLTLKMKALQCVKA